MDYKKLADEGRFYLIPGMEAYNARANELLQDSDHRGIVLYGANDEEEWRLLYNFCDQYVSPGIRRDRPAPRDTNVPIKRHAVCLYNYDTDGLFDKKVDSGWCDVDWFMENSPYNNSEYYTFDEAFRSVVSVPVISPEALDEMF